jgi:hypothetical protein
MSNDDAFSDVCRRATEQIRDAMVGCRSPDRFVVTRDEYRVIAEKGLYDGFREWPRFFGMDLSLAPDERKCQHDILRPGCTVSLETTGAGRCSVCRWRTP